MDKNLFFGSLCFLNKYITDDWPAQINGYSAKIILEEVSLSVEVDEGPIFVTNGTNDPSMFVSDILMLESSLGSPSSSTTSLSQGTPKISQRQNSSSHDDDVAPTMTKLLLRLDKSQKFAIDLYRVVKIYTQQGTDILPISFIIEFHECKFRFFSMKLSEDRIQNAFNVLAKIPRHASYTVGISSSPSSTVADASLQQSIREKIQMLQSARQGIGTIVYRNHSRSSSPEQTCQFLNTTATLLSSSYATPSEIEEAARAHNETLDTIHQELDDLLVSFFPRAKQLRRIPNEANGTEMDSKAKVETSVLRAQELLQRKHSTQEYRHKLVYLNVKGE
jgi:hypothetical protein